MNLPGHYCTRRVFSLVRAFRDALLMPPNLQYWMQFSLPEHYHTPLRFSREFFGTGVPILIYHKIRPEAEKSPAQRTLRPACELRPPTHRTNQ